MSQYPVLGHGDPLHFLIAIENIAHHLVATGIVALILDGPWSRTGVTTTRESVYQDWDGDMADVRR